MFDLVRLWKESFYTFYASVECLHHPEIRDKPVAVGGDIEQRHGIILAKNQIAKRFRIATEEAIWQAKEKCPELVVLPPDFPLYLRFSRLAREIYLQYSNQVESFGLLCRLFWPLIQSHTGYLIRSRRLMPEQSGRDAGGIKS